MKKALKNFRICEKIFAGSDTGPLSLTNRAGSKFMLYLRIKFNT